MILEMNFDGVITDKETIDVGNFLEGHETLRDKFSTFGVKANPLDAVVRQGEPSADVCEWEQDQDGVYFTKCDNAFFFDTGGIADNKGKYCFYCGKVIKEIKAKEQTA